MGQRPAKTIKSGKVQLAVWKNHSEKYGETESYTLSKYYKDKNGEGKSSTSFNATDLADVIAVCQSLRASRVRMYDNQPQQEANTSMQYEESKMKMLTDDDIPF